jgi:hypothetical protein
VKVCVLIAVPLGVVTVTTPVFARLGTMAWISEGVTTVKVFALTPPNVTSVAPAKPPPTMPTCVPTGHADQAEPLVRAAIVEFEKENADPDATSAYTLLSRTLLRQGKVEESRKAIQHAAELGHHSSDPALTLPITIQTARIEMAAAGQDGTCRVC